MTSLRLLLLLTAGVFAFSGFSIGSDPELRPSTVSPQDEKEDEKQDEKGDDEKEDGEKADDEEKAEDAERPSGYTEEQEQAILEHFHANEMEFQKNGRLRLVYEFEDEVLAVRLMDFSPAMETTQKRIRWALRNDEGLMIAEYGQFVHNAEWLADVKANVSGTCYSQFAAGDLFVVGLMDPKKGRDMVGSNLGEQCIKLKAMSPPPRCPGRCPALRVEQKVNFGFELELGTLHCLKSERRISISTEKKPKFTRKFERGRVGLRWKKNKGHVQFCLDQIVIEGRLDPKWVEKEIF